MKKSKLVFPLLSSNYGYTLLEALLVLLIFSLVSSFSISITKAAYEASKRNQFIFQLQQDLYYAQQKAISERATVTVVFLNGSKEYRIRQRGEIILRRQYEPANVVVLQATMSLEGISFLSDGNAQRAGTLIIQIDNYSYRLVMLLGRGRFYIEQL